MFRGITMLQAITCTRSEWDTCMLIYAAPHQIYCNWLTLYCKLMYLFIRNYSEVPLWPVIGDFDLVSNVVVRYHKTISFPNICTNKKILKKNEREIKTYKRKSLYSGVRRRNTPRHRCYLENGSVVFCTKPLTTKFIHNEFIVLNFHTRATILIKTFVIANINRHDT